jgi:prepilin signal peptidase PulO-like enzyme (type II secretory pathway)
MGYGDMLLMGCIGAFAGWRGTLAAIFGGTVVGLFAIILVAGFAALRRGKSAEPPPEEAENTESAAPEANPLGRRVFAADYGPVCAALLGGLGWMWHSGNGALLWPGAVFLAIIFALAAVKRQRFTLHEPWLVLAVFVGVILSAIFPRMQGVAATEIWFVNAIRGGAAAAIATVVGAGAALWVMELGNLARYYFFPALPSGPALDDYHQISGEGYLLLFGAVGVFCGAHAAVVAVAVFAVVGAIKTLASLPGAKPIAASTAEDDALPTDAPSTTAAAAVEPSTWTLGQEIPFGPSLAFGGFLYYAWPWLHLNVDQYLKLVRETFLGN